MKKIIFLLSIICISCGNMFAQTRATGLTIDGRPIETDAQRQQRLDKEKKIEEETRRKRNANDVENARLAKRREAEWKKNQPKVEVVEIHNSPHRSSQVKNSSSKSAEDIKVGDWIRYGSPGFITKLYSFSILSDGSAEYEVMYQDGTNPMKYHKRNYEEFKRLRVSPENISQYTIE